MVPDSSTDDDRNAAFAGLGSQTDGSSNGNTLVLSLYLIDSEDDLLHLTQGSNDVNQRARLYKRLCQACTIANDMLRQSSSSVSNENGNRHDPPQKQYHHPWSSGGDGPIFGVHCDIHSDESFINATNDIDGDDIWQSQPPAESGNKSADETINADHKRENGKIMTITDPPVQHQPHLRAICHYNNDVNDMWRCISLALQISSVLSDKKLSCAIECWDMSDGHILLIEAAEHLPSWVDDDALQGGVGGPKGCRNRCWIVNGKVNLIPPSTEDLASCMSQRGESPPSESVKELSRSEVLSILMKSIQNNAEGRLLTSCPDPVQRAIQYRINRTDYSCTSRVPKHTLPDEGSPHWHTAAAALPASVARFIQIHPYLVPFLVDSFCECAPAYLREVSIRRQETRTSGGDATNTAKDGMDSNKTPSDGDSPRPTTTNYSFGNTFPYEEIVLCPIIFTRTNYAELVTGRGIVPTFPVPTAYRSVELNRFQRQLRQSAFVCDDQLADDCSKRRTRNPFHRAVDVGIRLCAGLDWILSNTGDKTRSFVKNNVMDLEDSAIDTLGEIERRLRIYWTMVDAEAAGKCDQTQLPWIEQAWQVGPNSSQTPDFACDKSWLEALESMSKCHVFNPELCKPLWKEPCPYTRPGSSVCEMARSGIQSALNWHRKMYNHDYFPIPRAWEVDDDSWMEVDSLEELEEEMKSISNREVNADSQQRAETSRPRRTTRRSRRNLTQGDRLDEEDEQPLEEAKTTTKMLTGIRSFIEGDGELEGAVTNNVAASHQQSETSAHIDEAPEPGQCEKVNINPRRFLNRLHSMLREQNESGLGDNSDNIDLYDENEEPTIDDNISKYFFHEDLDNGNMSDDSEFDSDDAVLVDGENGKRELQSSVDQDPWSLQNIMVRTCC